MCRLNVITLPFFVAVSTHLVLCGRHISPKDSKSTGELRTKLNTSFNLHRNENNKKSSGLTLNVSDILNNVTADFATIHSVLGVSEDGNLTDLSSPGLTLSADLSSVLPLCDEDLWIPLFINETRHKLQLEACLKFIILNTGSKNTRLIVNSSLLLNIWPVGIFASDSEINISVAIWINNNTPLWTLDLNIQKNEMTSYYWSQLRLVYFITSKDKCQKVENVHRFETKIHSSYHCKSEATIMLHGDVAVVVKDLKYRAFWVTDRNFQDEDINHCPSVFWEFIGIATLTGFIIVVTVITIIWKCLKQSCFYNRKSNVYREFGSHHFEP